MVLLVSYGHASEIVRALVILSTTFHYNLNLFRFSSFSLQGARRQHSLTPSPQQELPTQSLQLVVKATSASVAVTARSRATTTTKRRAGSGEAARPMLSMAWSSRGAL